MAVVNLEPASSPTALARLGTGARGVDSLAYAYRADLAGFADALVSSPSRGMGVESVPGVVLAAVAAKAAQVVQGLVRPEVPGHFDLGHEEARHEENAGSPVGRS